MFEKIRKFFSVKPSPPIVPKTDQRLVEEALKEGKCPDCGGLEFLDGPQGCGSRNIECENCGSNFNIFPDSIPPTLVERIGWNRSGRWQEKGKLKAAS